MISLVKNTFSIADKVVFALDEVVRILLGTYPDDPIMKAFLQKIRARVEVDAKAA
jgi:hypothetical protein